MVNIWELDGINSEDRQHFEKEVASGLHHYVLLEFADGTTKYVKTKIHGGDGNMRVPSSARLVSRQDNRVASIPAVSGG